MSLLRYCKSNRKLLFPYSFSFPHELLVYVAFLPVMARFAFVLACALALLASSVASGAIVEHSFNVSLGSQAHQL